MWSVPTCFQHQVWWAGLLYEAAAEDLGICQSPAVLGGKSPAVATRHALPNGRECAEALEGHGAFNHAYLCRGPGGCPFLTLGQDYIILEPADPPTSWEWSHSRNWRAHMKGTFMVVHCIGHSKPTATHWAVTPSPVPTQKAESLQEEASGWWQVPPPGFMEIARSLWGTTLPMKLQASHQN